MIFVGDYFALVLVIILCCFYFDSKRSPRFLTTANKYFVACLLLTAAHFLYAAYAYEHASIIQFIARELW